jgi:hypothetical protein
MAVRDLQAKGGEYKKLADQIAIVGFKQTKNYEKDWQQCFSNLLIHEVKEVKG